MRRRAVRDGAFRWVVDAGELLSAAVAHHDGTYAFSRTHRDHLAPGGSCLAIGARRRRPASPLVALTCLLLAASCGNEPLLPADPARFEVSNVVLISLDTTRADHLSIYGYPHNTTPFLRELARESVVYERAYTPSTWTLPSHASLLTGLFPSQHGATTGSGLLGARPLPDDAVTLAEVFGSMGYLTMGVVGSRFLSRSLGIDQGFELYSDEWNGPKRPAQDINEVAL
ncbi:MAG: sulfatase-like hydrolase/transferase, partial [Myxococcota bacterium]